VSPDAWSAAMSVSDRGDMRPGLSPVTSPLLRSAGYGRRGMRRARCAARASSYGRALSRRHCSGYCADRLHAGVLHHRLSDATRLGLLVASHAVLSGPDPGRNDVCVHLPVAAISLLPCFPVLSSGEAGMLTGVWPRPAGTGRSGGAWHGESGIGLVQRGMQSRVHGFHVQYARTSLHAALPSVT